VNAGASTAVACKQRKGPMGEDYYGNRFVRFLRAILKLLNPESKMVLIEKFFFVRMGRRPQTNR
jgi:hypothetical protein